MTTRPLDILVVDDERPVAATLAAALARRGHSVRSTESAEKALALRAPEVLVCDVGLPGASGLELLASLRERGDRPHAVLITGHPTIEDCRRALRLGAAELLPKPFRLQDLVRAVEACPDRAAASAAGESGTGDALERTYVSTPACVERAARELAAFVLARGIGPATRARIASAASEVVDNARRHGYAHGRGRIFVHARCEARDVVVEIRDEGAGFDPEVASADCLHGSLGGGLARAHALSEDVHVDSAPGRGTRVVLKFTSWSLDFPEDGCVDLCERDWLTPDLARQVLHSLTRPETADRFRLPPALAVVVGRLLTGPEPEPARAPPPTSRGAQGPQD